MCSYMCETVCYSWYAALVSTSSYCSCEILVAIDTIGILCRLEHLRSLQSSLYDQMCSLEDTQLKQHNASTSLLNEEMQKMHQRLMKDSVSFVSLVMVT